MNILLITPDAYGGRGGIAQYNRDLISSLNSLKEIKSITVIPRNIHEEYGPIPEKVTFLDGATRSKWGFLRFILVSSLKKYDLVICGHINFLIITYFLSLRSSAKLALLIYGIEVWKRPKLKCISWFLNKVDSVWSISYFTYNSMKLWANMDRVSMAVIPNGINLDRYSFVEKSICYIGQHDLVNKKILLTVARLDASERYKGIDEVMEIFPRLLKKWTHLVYVIAGEGDDRSRLEEKAKKLGIENHVIFTGYVTESEKLSLYASVDVFAMPGYGEGFGFVFLEAMASGLPVVASKLDGSLEAVRHGLLGRAVNPFDIDDLYEGLDFALKDKRNVPSGLDYFSMIQFRERVKNAVFNIYSNKILEMCKK